MRMGFYSVYHINNYLIKWFTVIILCSITYIKHVASITNTGIICNENFPELETICLSLKKTCIVIIDYFY